MKKFGSSAAAIAKRRQTVYRLHLRAFSPREIAPQVGASERTVERDVQEIEISLKAIVPAEHLRTLKRAYAELEEAKRECWSIYHRPKQIIIKQDGTRVELDDSQRKYGAMDRILRIEEAQNRLTGLIPAHAVTPTTPEVSAELRTKVAVLSQEERILLARIIEKLEHT